MCYLFVQLLGITLKMKYLLRRKALDTILSSLLESYRLRFWMQHQLVEEN